MKPLTSSSSAIAALMVLSACSPQEPPVAQDRHSETEHEVRLTTDQTRELGIELRTAGPASLTVRLELPGEIVLNADQVAHIVPRVPGVVREVRKRIGDRVRPDEVMAILDSRELAASKTKYLAAVTRVELAKATFQREERLWKRNVGAEQEYLQAKNDFEEAKVSLREAKQALHALGLSGEAIRMLAETSETDLTRYEIRAPFEGELIERHVVRGELLKEDSQAFVIADLSSVWVDLTVYQKDLSSVRVGQEVVVTAGRESTPATGIISYVSPLVEEATRTATARVVLDNQGGELRPGLFVTGTLVAGRNQVALAVTKSALVNFEGKPVVFVETEDGFAPRAVTMGTSSDEFVEVTAGLVAGERYVANGSFSLKAELSKDAFSGTGHQH